MFVLFTNADKIGKRISNRKGHLFPIYLDCQQNQEDHEDDIVLCRAPLSFFRGLPSFLELCYFLRLLFTKDLDTNVIFLNLIVLKCCS